MRLASNVQDIIQKLQKDKKASKEWNTNSELQFAFLGLVERINSFVKPDPIDARKPLRKVVLELLNKYGTKSQRDASPTEYIDHLQNAIGMMSEGNRLLNCFYGDLPSGVGAGRYKQTSPEESDTMSFGLHKKDDDKNQFERVVTFNTAFNPIQALTTLAHEFEHSCATENMLPCLKNYNKNKVSDDCTQQLAVEELKAYRTDTKLFAELAKEIPSLACGLADMSVSYGGIPTSIFDTKATTAEKIESGDFIHSLIENYRKIGTYSSGNAFYQKSENGNIQKLRLDFVQKIKANGFTVKEQK
jgi:hypothetical protein